MCVCRHTKTQGLVLAKQRSFTRPRSSLFVVRTSCSSLLLRYVEYRIGCVSSLRFGMLLSVDTYPRRFPTELELQWWHVTADSQEVDRYRAGRFDG